MSAYRTQNGNAVYAMLQADLMRMPVWKKKRKRDKETQMIAEERNAEYAKFFKKKENSIKQPLQLLSHN